MILGKVVGNVVATIKHPSYAGRKLLLVRPLHLTSDKPEEDFIAVDAAHAGIGDTVLVCQEGNSTRQVIGVSDPAYLETMAGALALLGTRHALLVSSQDGLDELSLSGPTSVVEVVGEEVRMFTVSPEEVSLNRAPAEAIPGGDPQANAETTRRIFAGEDGPPRDLAALNAGAAIYAAGGAESLEEGVRRAEAAIDSGAAAEALERFVTRTRELAP